MSQSHDEASSPRRRRRRRQGGREEDMDPGLYNDHETPVQRPSVHVSVQQHPGVGGWGGVFQLQLIIFTCTSTKIKSEKSERVCPT